MKTMRLINLSLLCLGFQALSLMADIGIVNAETIHITDGDSHALVNAIRDARETDIPTSIILVRNGRYVLPPEPITFGGVVQLNGNGAILESVRSMDDPESGTQLRIEPDASITLSNLEFSGEFARNPWLMNRGHLTLRKVTVDGTLNNAIYGGPPQAITGQGTLILTKGEMSSLFVANSTFAIHVIPPHDVPLIDGVEYTLIRAINGASVNLRHVSLYNALELNDDEVPTEIVGLQTGKSVGNTEGFDKSTARVSNSLLLVSTEYDASSGSFNATNACEIATNGTVISLGGNISNDPDCGFEKTVPDVAFGEFGDHGGLVPTLPLRGISPAVDFGAEAYCLATDARGFVRGAQCDSGAFELGAGSAFSDFDEEGFSGYWYHAGEPGFLAITRPGSERILLVWSTYDAQGQAATVYGVGEFEGENIITSQAYSDEIIPGSNPPRVEPVPWGTFRFELINCLESQFSWQTDQPGFSSGELELDRLTYIRGIGCTQTE